MPTLTNNFGLSKPLVNNATDADLWGGQLNTNWDDTDGYLAKTTSTKTSDFDVLSSEFNYTYLIDASSAAVTATLPEASSVFNGFVVRFKATDITNTITIDGNGSETIDGAANVTIDETYGILEIVCDGTNWQLSVKTAPESTETIAGTVEKATQAEMESETAEKNVTADNIKHAKGVAVAWVRFNGTGVLSVNDSYNVTSVTDNGTGDYTVNFTNALADGNYAFSITASDTSRPAMAGPVTAPSTTALRVVCENFNGNRLNCNYVSVIVWGELA